MKFEFTIEYIRTVLRVPNGLPVKPKLWLGSQTVSVLGLLTYVFQGTRVQFQGTAAVVFCVRFHGNMVRLE